MRWRNDAHGYGAMAVLLHWSVVLLVIGLFGLGLYMVTLTYYDPLYRTLPQWHKDFGALLVALFVVRFAWRVANPRPASLPGHQPWERRLARFTHGLLYLLPFALALFGYLISTADGRPMLLWGEALSLPAWVVGMENQEDVAGDIHRWLAYGLMGLVALHALGALKHHFLDGDRTLKRMFGR